jgi:hypothetical protein
MPLHDFARASLLLSRGMIRLGPSLALPKSREAVENVDERNWFESWKKGNECE